MNKKIGVLGGGQLGRMLLQEVTKFDQEIWFMDNSFDTPVGRIYPYFVQGDFKSYDDVISFGSNMDIITVEIENVNTDALTKLEESGIVVRPQSRVLKTIKDKGIQKQFYLENDIASSEFFLVTNKQDIIDKISNGILLPPFVQKARTAGYDGKGVKVIYSESDIPDIMDTPSVIEKLVDIKKELAIIVGRNAKGQKTFFPVTEMVFNKEAHLLDYLQCPAEITEETYTDCVKLADQIITNLEMIGILAVELFLTNDGQILVNEVAPRPHNSGHHTIDAGSHSQYNIHLRTLLDWDLPEVKQTETALMINVLGEKNHTGPTYYEGLDSILTMDKVYPHLYGKEETRPLRKMGHVNIVGENLDEVKEKMTFVKSSLKVKAWGSKSE